MRALANWSDRQNCSHNVSQKFKRIRHFSDVSRKNSLIVCEFKACRRLRSPVLSRASPK